MPVLISVLAFVTGTLLAYFILAPKARRLFMESEILSRENELLKSQIASHEAFKEESLKAAKAAVFEVSQSVSSKLIEDHKRENQEAKKQAEEITKRETENLHKEFKTVVETLNRINGQYQSHDKKLAAIWQSLTAPVKASNFAEIGLENTLKNFGLEQGIDFYMQSAIEGTRLRPDAIINLPSGNQILIDAKTSKYFIEIAAEENDASALKDKLRQSMGTHLQQLVSRDYVSAGKAKLEGSFIVNVMYLPNDTAYARVLECDPTFSAKCRDSGVLLATPTSLNMLLAIATHQISREKQERNHQEIVKEMGKMISSLGKLFENISSVGKAIQSSAAKFEELAKSVNSRLLPRTRRVLSLGLETEKELKLPDTIGSYTLVENQSPVIELESSETMDDRIKPALLEKKAV